MSSIVKRYKIPLLISLVIGLAVLALKAESFWLNAIFAFLGSILAIFFLDIEYFIHAYLIDPSAEISKRIKESMAEKKISKFIDYINSEEYTFGEMAVRSVLFQIILLAFSLYVITTGQWIFMQAFGLSLLANIFYAQIIEYAKTKTLERWFWVYSGELNENLYKAYLFVTFLIFAYQFTFV